MGYHIKAVHSVARSAERRAQARSWKLQFIKTEDGQTRIRDIPEAEYRAHGFLPSMTLDQAKEQKRMANEKLKREEDDLRRVKSLKAQTEREKAQFLFLKEDDVRAFETEVLFRRIARGKEGALRRNRVLSHWNVVKDMICALKIDPSDWNRSAFRFYNHFADHGFAPSYTKKLMRILNAWGYFSAYRSNKPFMPVDPPTGMDRAHIANSFQAKKRELERAGKHVAEASAPLAPDWLRKRQKQFSKPEQYNWVFASLWFGLRPQEVDGLLDPKAHRIEYDAKHRVKVLWVYQPKLVMLEEEERWKAIPCLYKEQIDALGYIQEGKIDRPLAKTLQAALGEEYTLYAGRKGFEDLMATVKGHPLEVVSEWMGHQSVEMTWQKYRNRKRVRV